MSIITNSVTDAVPKPFAWENLGGAAQLSSVVPRGKLLYFGTTVIALKIAGDETTFNLTLELPPGFAYIPRYIAFRVVSTTLVLEFELIGSGQFLRPSIGTETTWFSIESPGASNYIATSKQQIYTPSRGSPKVVMKGGDSLRFFLADMDAGETPITNIIHMVEFLVFDVDQVDKWEINTPTPVTTQVF